MLVLRLPLAGAAERHVFDRSETGAAPDLLNAEVLSTIRDHERRGLIDTERSRAALESLLLLPIARYPSLPFTDRCWMLRHNFSAYDALYVALAEALGTRLVTADAALARAAADHTEIEVTLLE